MGDRCRCRLLGSVDGNWVEVEELLAVRARAAKAGQSGCLSYRVE